MLVMTQEQTDAGMQKPKGSQQGALSRFLHLQRSQAICTCSLGWIRWGGGCSAIELEAELLVGYDNISCDGILPAVRRKGIERADGKATGSSSSKSGHINATTARLQCLATTA